MCIYKKKLLPCVFPVLFLTTVVCKDVIVETKLGKIIGTEKVISDEQKFLAFTGIPYAKPPVGKLRFKAPQPISPWTKILNATASGSYCIQWDEFFHNPPALVGEEDCLFLNVYTKDVTSKRPVLVYIHGGGFFMGSGSYDALGPQIIMKRDIVLVTINYRLGILGFLSTGNEHLPGNMGLKDQSLALKWVKENIESFGGDPEKITVSGESAGAISVHYHMLSPMSKGLFTSAISISGTAMCLSAFVPTEVAQMRSKKVASYLKCPQTLDQKMVDCIAQKDVKKIVSLLPKFKEFFMTPLIAMGPTLETQTTEPLFLHQSPYDLITSGKAYDVPWLTGITSNEGLVFALLILQNEELLTKLQDEESDVFPILFDYKHTAKDTSKVTKSLKEFYFGSKKIEKSLAPQFSQIISDNMFNDGLYQAVTLHQTQSQKSKIYAFVLSAQSDMNMAMQIVNKNNVKEFGFNSLKAMGTSHGEDIQYMFMNTFTPPMKENSNNEKVSNNIMDIIIAFAETGIPHSDWKPTNNNLDYFNIDVKMRMKDNFPVSRAKLWSSLSLTNNGRPVPDALGKEEL